MIPEAARPTAVPAPMPTTYSVCAEGCDFGRIQEALDSAAEDDHVVIAVLDAEHTEAGIVVTGQATIRGLGVEKTIVQAHEEPGEATDRVITIKKGATVVLQGLTLRHGNPQPDDDQGGAIYNFGTLTLDGCSVSNNRANGGGGISNTGTLTLLHSSVSDNTAHGQAAQGKECGNGGGIKCGSGRLTLISSTVSDNLAGKTGRNRGGGMFVGCSCAGRIVNSTFSGNEALHTTGRTYDSGQGRGAGIFAVGPVQIFHCTIANNRASSDGGGILAQGTLHAAFNIVAGNRGRGEQCVVGPEGSLDIHRFNLVEGGGCGAEQDGSALVESPLLGPLADNGGPTWTHLPSQGSPAIDAVPEGQCSAAVDQRGASRPAGGGGEVSLCDLGAIEVQEE